jgi:hypothetical protein
MARRKGPERKGIDRRSRGGAGEGLDFVIRGIKKIASTMSTISRISCIPENMDSF